MRAQANNDRSSRQKKSFWRRCVFSLMTAMAVLLFVHADTQSQTPFGVNTFTFDPGTGISNRLITPNGDGFNDVVVFTFSNPRDSAITGRIFDVGGGKVGDMQAGPAVGFPNATLRWAPSDGIKGGVYIYQIRSEETVHTGTVVVIK
jgi:hypothetical protein